MQQNNQEPNSQESTAGARPVPKENLQSEQNQQQQVNSQPLTQEQNNDASQNNLPNQQSSQIQPTQTQSKTPVTETNKEQVQVKTEKKKKGLINKNTCCIGSCVGCLLILIALVLLGIFAAPVLSKYLNKMINPGIEVPELKDVDLTDLDNEVSSILDEAGSQTITVSEDEYNQLLKRDYGTYSEEAQLDADFRADFEEDQASLLMKFTKWMPWALVEMTSDSEGQITTDSIKLGPVSIGSYVKKAVEENMEEGQQMSSEVDMSSLLARVVFDDEIEQVTIEGIYFKDDEIEFDVTIVDTDSIEE